MRGRGYKQRGRECVGIGKLRRVHVPGIFRITTRNLVVSVCADGNCERNRIKVENVFT